MKEHESEEARTEAAVDLSLGLLAPSESERLKEHLRSGCAECEAEAFSFAQVAGALAMSANPVEPPPHLRGRLLQAVAGLSASSGRSRSASLEDSAHDGAALAASKAQGHLGEVSIS